MKKLSNRFGFLWVLFVLFFITLTLSFIYTYKTLTFVLIGFFLIINSSIILFMVLTTLNFKVFSFISSYTYFFSNAFLFICLNIPATLILIRKGSLLSSELVHCYLFVHCIYMVLSLSSHCLCIYCLHKPSNTSWIGKIFFMITFILSGIGQIILLLKPQLILYFSFSTLHWANGLLCILNLLILFIYPYFLSKIDSSQLMKDTLPTKYLLSLSCTLYILFGSIYHMNRAFSFIGICSILILLALYFSIVYQHSFLKQFMIFSDKLSIHERNTVLMNKYIESMAKSQETMVKQYSQMDAIYTQMLLFYPDPLLMIIDDQIIHSNTHANQLLEADTANILMNTSFLDYILPAYYTDIAAILGKLYKHTLPKGSIELKMQTVKGNIIEVEAVFTLSKAQGDVLLLSARDISDRKKQEALSQQVALEKLKVEFFSTLSHELKTPVNIIYSAVQLQNTLLTDGAYEKACYYNSMVSQNCMRLLRLLNNLLDLNRIESNYFSFSPQSLNIVHLTEAILDSIIPYANKKEIALLFDTQDEEIYVSIDPDLYERILLNLFSNAIKYTPSHGHLSVFIKQQGNQVSICIEDNGIGIPPDQLDTIFQRFVRVENGLIRQAEGAGIGLSLVKSLVGMNKGTIAVHSSPGKGSKFVLMFPIENQSLDHHLSYAYMCSKDKVEIEFSDVFVS